MIQFSSFMWFLAIFFGLIGFLRGWRKELLVTVGVLLATFAIFQFDNILRGSLFFGIPARQVLYMQLFIFLAVTVYLYRADDIGNARRRDDGDIQAGFLGALSGALNGYLIGGAIWYFFDINEYPLESLAIAPSPISPSAQAINWMPIVLLGGGASGTGDLLAVGVLILLFVVLITV